MNEKLRDYAKQKNVKLWEVAELIGIHDTALSKLMRHDLGDNKTKDLMDAIDMIAELKDENRKDK